VHVVEYPRVLLRIRGRVFHVHSLIVCHAPLMYFYTTAVIHVFFFAQ